MKNLLFVPVALLTTLALTNNCKKNNNDADIGGDAANRPDVPGISHRTVASSEFTTGVLLSGSTQVVPIASLKSTGGVLGGNPILIDNMPEKVTTQGWLLSPPRINNVRQPVTGNADLYAFHFNATGASAYYVVLATNPLSTTSTVSTQGVLLAKDDVGGFTFPDGYFIERESYDVADRFMNANYNVNNTFNIPGLGSGSANNAIITYRAVGNGNGIDGRFKMQVSGQAYVYTVMIIQQAGETIAQMLNRAVNLATTDTGTPAEAAKRANGEWQDTNGYIVETFANSAPTGTVFNRYGRESGLYSRSAWIVNNNVDLPATTGYLGMCMIVDQKKTPVVYPEDQTAAATALNPVDTRRYAALTGWNNANRSYGNFGHYYEVTLNLRNNKTTSRNVRLSFAYNVPGTSSSAVFVGTVKVRVGTGAESTIAVKNRFKEPKTILTPTAISVPAKSGATVGTATVRVRFYVPGLISAGHQLIVEALN